VGRNAEGWLLASPQLQGLVAARGGSSPPLWHRILTRHVANECSTREAPVRGEVHIEAGGAAPPSCHIALDSYGAGKTQRRGAVSTNPALTPQPAPQPQSGREGGLVSG
jgi:hypothetical protein